AFYEPGIGLVRTVLATPVLSLAAPVARGLLGFGPGPARGRGEPAVVGAKFRAGPVGQAAGIPPARPSAAQVASARALHCVNGGECNSVCPIFHESKIRLPQMLTHAGEALHAGVKPGATVATLLDLCMRCGNCEEVCQAGIPPLPLYERMQQVADVAQPY